MTKEEERAYELGRRAVLTQLLRTVLRELGREDDTAQMAALLLEREATVAALRAVCREYGDNEWEETVHLADVIEKHLGRHLSRHGGGTVVSEMTSEARLRAILEDIASQARVCSNESPVDWSKEFAAIKRMAEEGLIVHGGGAP